MISETDMKCPVCGSPVRLLYRGNTDPRDFFTRGSEYHIAEGQGKEKCDVYECMKCGLGFTPLFGNDRSRVQNVDAGVALSPSEVPRDQRAGQNFDPSVLDRFYRESPYDEEYLKEEGGRRKAFRKVLGRIEKICPAKGKLFEIGASAGFFLDEARARGWSVGGSESAQWARQFAAEHLGITYSESLGVESDSSLDVIVLFDVIEHVASPESLLRSIFQKLKPGGLLVLTTPRFEALTRKMLGSRWYFMFPAHIWYFSRRSLEMLFRKIGFQSFRFRWHTFFFSIQYFLLRFPNRLRLLAKLPGKWLRSLIIPFHTGDDWQVYAKKPAR